MATRNPKKPREITLTDVMTVANMMLDGVQLVIADRIKKTHWASDANQLKLLSKDLEALRYTDKDVRDALK